jgi:hypothetical protein
VLQTGYVANVPMGVAVGVPQGYAQGGIMMQPTTYSPQPVSYSTQPQGGPVTYSTQPQGFVYK